MALKARATKPLQCLGCERFYHAHELVLSIVANVCIRCFANARMGNRLLQRKSRLKHRSDKIMSPKKKETQTKTTKKRRTTSKLSKAEKLKAEAERLLIEASEAEESEEEEVDEEDEGEYTESGLKKMKIRDLRSVAKDLGLTTKGVKKEDLISEILDVQDYEDEDEEEGDAVDVDFDNAGSFDRESGDFTPDKDYKRLFASVDFKTVKGSMFQALVDKEDFEWFILATDATKKKGEDGIFMRLSESGQSFIFYLHERLFCIPISHIENDDGSFDSIGVSEVTFS